MIKMLIDCDTGVDDSIAILFALNRPDVEIIGFSTSTGNVTAKQGADNTLRLIKLSNTGAQIPICVGAEAPLIGIQEEFPDFIHGQNGIGNVILPKSEQQPVDQSVEDFLYEKACQNDGELVLITLGRLTNIANTIKKYPDFSKKIKRAVSMGGTIYMKGNVTPVAEANIAGDPEAADIFMTSGIDITLVGLDVTERTRLTMEDIDRLSHCCREECRDSVSYMKEALTYYMNGCRVQNQSLENSPLHDPLAMVVAVDPSVVTTQKRITRIECNGTYCRGMVVTDLREQPVNGNFVEVCLEVNARKALNELFTAFQ